MKSPFHMHGMTNAKRSDTKKKRKVTIDRRAKYQEQIAVQAMVQEQIDIDQVSFDDDVDLLPQIKVQCIEDQQLKNETDKPQSLLIGIDNIIQIKFGERGHLAQKLFHATSPQLNVFDEDILDFRAKSLTPTSYLIIVSQQPILFSKLQYLKIFKTMKTESECCNNFKPDQFDYHKLCFNFGWMQQFLTKNRIKIINCEPLIHLQRFTSQRAVIFDADVVQTEFGFLYENFVDYTHLNIIQRHLTFNNDILKQIFAESKFQLVSDSKIFVQIAEMSQNIVQDAEKLVITKIDPGILAYAIQQRKQVIALLTVNELQKQVQTIFDSLSDTKMSVVQFQRFCDFYQAGPDKIKPLLPRIVKVIVGGKLVPIEYKQQELLTGQQWYVDAKTNWQFQFNPTLKDGFVKTYLERIQNLFNTVMETNVQVVNDIIE